MRALAPVFASSGDLRADRRFQLADAYRAGGDLDAAADLLAQALDLVPDWAAGWSALGDVRAARADAAGALDAYDRALALDPADRLGIGLKRARLGGEPADAMSSNYVAALFDQHAAEFEAALGRLGYRGPALIVDALAATAGPTHRFARVLDLGCGTGLMGAVLAGRAGALVGVDLSAKMLAIARGKGLYAALHRADMLAFLAGEPAASADLVVAADAFVYVADLGPLVVAAARVLRPGGILAFSLEHLAEGDVELGPSLRYRHSDAHVAARAAAAGLAVVHLVHASARSEAGVPVPGAVVVLAKPA